MNTIGKRLRELREDKRLSQLELAEIFNKSQVAISKYENDKRELDYEMLNKYSRYFNVSIDCILGNKEKKQQQECTPVLNEKDEKDIAKRLNVILENLESQQDALMFDGEALDDETKELLKISLENSIRTAKVLAKKKYTPKKYRK